MMKRILTDWVPVISGAAAFTLFAVYYVLLEMNIGSLSEVPREQGKVLWGSSSFVLNLAMIWCAVVSWITIRQFSISFERTQRVAIFLIFVLLYICLAPLSVSEIAGRAGSSLLSNIGASGVANAALIISMNNIAAVLVVMLFILAFVFVGCGAEEVSVRSLADRIHSFNLLLYSGGVVLAAAVYQFHCLFQWAASLESHQLSREALQSFASSIAVGGGLVFSSLLLLIVAPPAIRLNRRLSTIMSESVGPEEEFDPQKWLIKRGIETTPLRSLNAYIALLLPLATGLLTKVFGL